MPLLECPDFRHRVVGEDSEYLVRVRNLVRPWLVRTKRRVDKTDRNAPIAQGTGDFRDSTVGELNLVARFQ